MLSPALALTGVVVAFTLSVLLFYFQILSYTTFFFFPIFMLIAYHTLVMQIITPQRPNKKPWPVVIKKSVGKYLFWLGLIGALCGVYKHHPFYVNFAAHTISMIEVFFKWYLIAAPFYFLYVERDKTGRLEWLNDPFLKFLSFLRAIYKKRWCSLRYRLLKSGYKSLLLSWLVRLHFIPVMVEQVYWGTNQLMGALARPELFLTNVMFFVGVLFLIDSTNASMGYFWESSLTKTRFRAVDPNAFHWIVVLMCYMPFIGFASNFVPFPKSGGLLVFNSAAFELVANILTVASLLGIVLTTSCLGFSYSNLSYKKIQTCGPYAVVRHPGT